MKISTLFNIVISPILITKKYILFLRNYFTFSQKANSRQNLKTSLTDLYPVLNESTVGTAFDRHYVYHLAWAARVVKKIKPKIHIDISSSLYFSTMLSAFLPVKFYDYRPANLKLDNLVSGKADLTKLTFKSNSISSLSCMHVVEHIGLGRYGDRLDPEGDLKAIKELKRVIADAGSLLIVVPIGKPRVMFNAHRIYSYEQVVGYFEGFKLKEFVLIPEDEKDGGLVINPPQHLLRKQNYGCGCFWFRK